MLTVERLADGIPVRADFESGPDSAPEVRGEAGRGEACEKTGRGVN